MTEIMEQALDIALDKRFACVSTRGLAASVMWRGKLILNYTPTCRDRGWLTGLDNVATSSHILGKMRVVGIRELKNRLREYLRIVRSGKTVLVTDRAEAVAEIRLPGSAPDDLNMSAALMGLVRRGTVSLGAPNRADVYTSLPPLLSEGAAAKLLDEERGER